MRVQFLRTQYGKLKKLKNTWRRPRGHQNKMRLSKKGKGITPKIGYQKSAKEAIPRIFSEKDLDNTKSEKVMLAKCVGKKKQAEIAKECEKKKITLLNPPAKIKAKKEAKKQSKK